jgi:hypothetical protein
MPSNTGVQILPSEASPEARFYIAATQAVGRPRRTLKEGDTFAVLDNYGDIAATPGAPNGLFYQDTRYLSHLELLINENRPLLLGSNIHDDNSALFVDLTNPDFILGQHVVLERHCAHFAHNIPLARNSIPTVRRAQLRRPAYRPSPIDIV